MLNFSNLNDVEFEYLCKDVMSRKLNVDFNRYTSGRDGGIDLAYFKSYNKVVVQVKHYRKSTYSNLLSKLKEEVSKVEKINPSQYYICCSMELTLKNKNEIYQLFSKYMKSDNNIIDLIDISDFLDKDENKDILKKHFKLWIESTNILTNMLHNDIFIDSEVLIDDIQEDVKMFVKTSAYNEAIKYLDSNNVLVIIGDPGVGKTMTSKMILLYYIEKDYKVRYSTDGENLSDLKKSLSQNPDEKEIIFLDDCFGQIYFKMKETQESELIQLVKYVSLHPNKKLLLNSRVTIYQEAKEKDERLVKLEDRNRYKLFILNVSNINNVEKALILYNHLYFCNVPKEYWKELVYHKRYLKIISHENYNPRIIEFITNKRFYGTIEVSDYYRFALECLNNPKQIWENEYTRRLGEFDRIFLNTLYSLTNTTVSIKLLKYCFDKRLRSFNDYDTTLNHFEEVLKRLNTSMIKIVDQHGDKMIFVSNPSINDFLSSYLKNNPEEVNAIIKSSCFAFQLERILSVEKYEEMIKRLIITDKIQNFIFESEDDKNDFIIYYCMKLQICDESFKSRIISILLSNKRNRYFIECNSGYSYYKLIFKYAFKDKFFSFYQLDEFFSDFENIEQIMSHSFSYLEEVVYFINQIDDLYVGYNRKKYVEGIKELLKWNIELLYYDVDGDDYDIYEFSDLIDRYGKDAVNDIEQEIKNQIIEDVEYELDNLSKDLIEGEKYIDEDDINVRGVDDLVDEYLNELVYDESRDYMDNYSMSDGDIIKMIFERNYED